MMARLRTEIKDLASLDSVQGEKSRYGFRETVCHVFRLKLGKVRKGNVAIYRRGYHFGQKNPVLPMRGTGYIRFAVMVVMWESHSEGS